MADRIDTLLGLLLEELHEVRRGADLAGQANLSRSHAARTFRQRFGESPAAFRRRLRLERAAFHLKDTAQSVTSLALDAGFDSLEGFTRAFRRVFGVSPSLYRRTGLRSHLLPAPSGFHYQPTGQALPTEENMDVLTHLLKFDEAFLRQALAQSRTLPDAALDTPLGESQPHPFDSPDHTLRDLLDKMVFTKEVWVAAVRGHDLPPADRPRHLDAIEARLDRASPAFLRVAQEVQQGVRWQQTFVDTLCEPPEVFPYGGMLAHVLNVDAHRRHILSAWLLRLGISVNTDPMHFGQVPANQPLITATTTKVTV